MNILVTGARGMVGLALCDNLKNIRDGKNRTRPNIKIEEIYEYDIDSTPEELDEYCQKADFVFNLAGINRPKTNDEFMQGNFGFGEKLLNTLKKYDNKAPVMLSSSIQATLIGRYGQSDYGKSKLAAATDSRITERASWQGRSCCSNTARRRARRSRFIASRTLWGTAARIITARFRPSATPLRTICPILSTIETPR